MEKMKINLEKLERYGNAFEVSERKELIAETLRVFRESCGLTQSEVAKYLGIRAGTYSTYENGTREIPAEILVRISLLYDMPTDVILQRDRLSRGNFEVQKQFEALEKEVDELRDTFTNKEAELNPEFVNLVKSMTDAFNVMGEKFSELNKNNNK